MHNSTNKNYLQLLEEKLDKENLSKLNSLDSPALVDFIGKYVELCNPKSVYLRTDSAQDIEYIRAKSLSLGEERKLQLNGQTLHFDGPLDQARDKKNTRYLTSQNSQLSSYVNTIDKTEGLNQTNEFLKGIMSGKEMLVGFFCLGPVNSDFSILSVQISDSYYVLHSENLLYRPGYQAYKNSKNKKDFFKFVHSGGELENMVSKNVSQRRVYIDLEENTVYSLNTQYAGNTVGLKKLALRLAINKASSEGWLAEHMFLMGVGDQNNEKTYFCGAFPSMCGKTSTAMLSGESIIGDDIAYLRKTDGKVKAVNVERGIFGIIKDVNPKDDAILFNSLTKEGEVIFSNILVDDQEVPYWIGKSHDLPSQGINFSGKWFPGKTDNEGKEITPSHKNARYTIKLKDLKNVDQNLENPQGVEIRGLIYGGRDSDTSCPVEEALSWEQGIITKAASLESETTAATLGQEGVRVFNPMSNVDFLSIPLGKYVAMNLEFTKSLNQPLSIFSVNYFLKDKDGRFLNGMQDKRIWLKWMRLRVDKKVRALSGPTGLIPDFEDLKGLFKEVLTKEYSQEDYVRQFSLRIPENLAKIERVNNIYKKVEDIPPVLFKELEAQKERLESCRAKFGDYVQPDSFPKVD